MPEKFYSFERALRELNLREEELKRLVSEGEIRAFRDEDKMKFRKEDVDRLRGKGGKGGPEAGGETVADAEDLIFDEEEDIDLDEEPGMATAPISTPAEEIEEVPAPAPKPAARPAAPVRKTTVSRTTRVKTTVPAEKGGSIVMMILLVASSLVLFYAIFVTLSTAASRTDSMTKGFAEKMYDMGFAHRSE